MTHPRKRIPLLGAVVAVLVALVLGGAAAQDAPPTVTLVMGNEGASAWLVTTVEGAEGVAATGEQNPALTFTVGNRYMFDTSGVDSSFHPLDFRDADGNVLLAQGSSEGSFEGDEAVAWEESAEMVAFTVTEELADALSIYRCTVHASMVGEVTIAGM